MPTEIPEVQVGQDVFYGGSLWQVVSVCHGQCSHRRQPGHYLTLRARDGEERNHVDQKEVTTNTGILRGILRSAAGNPIAVRFGLGRGCCGVVSEQPRRAGRRRSHHGRPAGAAVAARCLRRGGSADEESLTWTSLQLMSVARCRPRRWCSMTRTGTPTTSRRARWNGVGGGSCLLVRVAAA